MADRHQDPGKQGRCLIEILIADGDRRRSVLLRRILAAHRVRIAPDSGEACRAVADRHFHLVFLDPSLEGEGGIEAVTRSLLRRVDPPPVILHGEPAPIAMAVAEQLPRVQVVTPDHLQPGSRVHSRLQTLFAPGVLVHWESVRLIFQDP